MLLRFPLEDSVLNKMTDMPPNITPIEVHITVDIILIIVASIDRIRGIISPPATTPNNDPISLLLILLNIEKNAP